MIASLVIQCLNIARYLLTSLLILMVGLLEIWGPGLTQKNTLRLLMRNLIGALLEYTYLMMKETNTVLTPTFFQTVYGNLVNL